MKLKNVYEMSPVWLQKSAVSLYGGFQYFKRFGGGYSRVLAETAGIEHLEGADLTEFQSRRFREIFVHAFQNVPFYSEFYREHGIGLNDIKDLNDLSRLPIVSRELARVNQERLRGPTEKPYWTQHTSGSTGTPLTITMNRETYQRSMALLELHENRQGIARRDRRATFGGRMVVPAEHSQPPFWRYNPAARQMVFSAYHLNDRFLPYYLDELDRFGPKEIIGYPSAIHTVAEYCLRKKRKLEFKPHVVITNSETLFDWQKEEIEEAFGCKVADYYGSAECVVFADRREDERYHFSKSFGVVEIVSDGGNATWGQMGHLVCTTLGNSAMPLIRYQVGDEAIADDVEERDGKPTVQKATIIVGRTDDIVVTPDGKRIGRLDHIFKGVVGVRECQIVQESAKTIVLNLVTDNSFSADQRELLIRNLRERVGEDMELTVKNMSQIPRTASGKFRGVVSHVQR